MEVVKQIGDGVVVVLYILINYNCGIICIGWLSRVYFFNECVYLQPWVQQEQDIMELATRLQVQVKNCFV